MDVAGSSLNDLSEAGSTSDDIKGWTSMLRIAQIGFGGIGKDVACELAAAEGVQYVAVAARAHQIADVHSVLRDVPVVDSPSELIAARPDLVIECASHEALIAYAPVVLGSGVDMIAISAGALADDHMRDLILGKAGQSGASLSVASGAIGGVDVVAAAATVGINRISYITRKAPKLWRGTAAEEMIDLDNVAEPVKFFSDTARKAALLFPEKANVTATLALAGLGFDKTGVEFWADHGSIKSTHIISLDALTGRMDISLSNTVSQRNGKSSWLTAMSVVRLALSRVAPLRIGV
jgi:aspartate dehydrogenase